MTFAIIILRVDKMGFEIKERKHAYEKYKDNILVKTWIDKEMTLFRENNLMAEIELLKIIRVNKHNMV